MGASLPIAIHLVQIHQWNTAMLRGAHDVSSAAISLRQEMLQGMPKYKPQRNMQVKDIKKPAIWRVILKIM